MQIVGKIADMANQINGSIVNFLNKIRQRDGIIIAKSAKDSERWQPCGVVAESSEIGNRRPTTCAASDAIV